MKKRSSKYSMTKTLKIFAIGFIGVILIAPYLSRAQSEELKSALGEVLEGGNRIETKNIEARKNVLLKIINLAVLEATELKKNLKNTGNLEEEYLRLKKQYLGELDGYLGYYKSLKKQLGGDFNLEQIMAFGDDFKTWREANYDLGVKEIVNFVLTFQQDNALKIAEKRYAKTLKDAQKIKALSVKTEISGILSKAQVDLQEARALTDSAKELLLPKIEAIDLTTATATSAPIIETSTERIVETSTETSLVATSTSMFSTPVTISSLNATSTENETSTEVVVKQKTDIKQLIEGALAKTKDAYQKFFEVSALITKKSR